MTQRCINYLRWLLDFLLSAAAGRSALITCFQFLHLQRCPGSVLCVHPPPPPHTPARQMPSAFHHELISSTCNPFKMCAIMERHNRIQPSVTLPPLMSPALVKFRATGNNSQAPHKEDTSSDPHNNLELSPPWLSPGSEEVK